MKHSKSILFCILTILTGCATSSIISQNITLEMTTQEVLSKAGKPFSKKCYKDTSGNVVEEWMYKETTWDDGGWSWDKTIISTNILFENNKVSSFGNMGERFKTKNPMAPSINIDSTVYFD